MNGRMSRAFANLDAVALTDSASTTPEIQMEEWAGGSIHVVGTSITGLTFYGATEPGGTFVPLYDKTNTAVTRTVDHTQVYPLPDECFGLGAIKIVANAAGAVNISLKG